MAVFFTADLHLGHKNILRFRTEFQNIEKHDDYLIEQWNKKIKEDDQVYILGDLSFLAEKPVESYLSHMKGKKHLILGNHDGYWMKQIDNMGDYFEEVENLKIIKFGKQQFTLCHYPMLEWQGSRNSEQQTSYLIHGHIHARITPEIYGYIKQYQPHAFNAGVDINHFEPVTFDELKDNCNYWYKRGERAIGQ